MNHLHTIYDTDHHFQINAITREITSDSPIKRLVQFDHNSERFTFECPRYIEGHDMSLCSTIEIHYINISAQDKTQKSEDVYPVADLAVGIGTAETVTFSWLISGNATKHTGVLAFLVKFKCLTGDVIDYEWNTEIFKAITISDGMNNGEAVITEYSDVLQAWKIEIEDDFREIREALENTIIKTSSPNQLYGTDDTGEQTTYKIAASAASNSIVKRDAYGRFQTVTPITGSQAANKNYVDILAAPIILTSRHLGSGQSGYFRIACFLERGFNENPEDKSGPDFEICYTGYQVDNSFSPDHPVTTFPIYNQYARFYCNAQGSVYAEPFHKIVSDVGFTPTYGGNLLDYCYVIHKNDVAVGDGIACVWYIPFFNSPFGGYCTLSIKGLVNKFNGTNMEAILGTYDIADNIYTYDSFYDVNIEQAQQITINTLI